MLIQCVGESAALKRQRASEPNLVDRSLNSRVHQHVNEESLVYDDGDLYDASPPPPRSYQAQNMVNQVPQPTRAEFSRTSGDASEEPSSNATVVLRRPYEVLKTNVAPSQETIRSLEEGLLAKFRKVTKVLKFAQIDVTSKVQDFDKAESRIQMALQEYHKVEGGANERFSQVKLLCSTLDAGSSSASIKTAARACRDLGLLEEKTVLALLGPAIDGEEAGGHLEEVKMNLTRCENKLNRVSEMFDGD